MSMLQKEHPLCAARTASFNGYPRWAGWSCAKHWISNNWQFLQSPMDGFLCLNVLNFFEIAVERQK